MSHLGTSTIILADRLSLITVGASRSKSTSGRKQLKRRNLGVDKTICIVINGVGMITDIQRYFQKIMSGEWTFFVKPYEPRWKNQCLKMKSRIYRDMDCWRIVFSPHSDAPQNYVLAAATCEDYPRYGEELALIYFQHS